MATRRGKKRELVRRARTTLTSFPSCTHPGYRLEPPTARTTTTDPLQPSPPALRPQLASTRLLPALAPAATLPPQLRSKQHAEHAEPVVQVRERLSCPRSRPKSLADAVRRASPRSAALRLAQLLCGSTRTLVGRRRG